MTSTSRRSWAGSSRRPAGRGYGVSVVGAGGGTAGARGVGGTTWIRVAGLAAVEPLSAGGGVPGAGGGTTGAEGGALAGCSLGSDDAGICLG